jgi:ATP-dependent exoDNAse (exonuclease V) alpha subunit
MLDGAMRITSGPALRQREAQRHRQRADGAERERVNTYRWQGGKQATADIISEPDKGARYSRLAQEFAASVREGQESVAQISGTREQGVLNGIIRDTLKNEGVLGRRR